VSREYPSTRHFETVVTDRVVEEPWAVSKVRAGERVLDVGSATSRYLREMPPDCRVYAIDIRTTPPQPGIGVVLGNLLQAPFKPGSFDAVTCISTIEHIGLDVYAQGPDEFGDEVATRHLRRLLRPGGRVLVSVPFGRRAVSAWLRVYDWSSFRRLTGGYRILSVEFYRREGDSFLPCRREDLADAGFDFAGMRSDGLVLAELTPAGGGRFLLARALLRLRRTWRHLTRRGRPFWSDRWSGEPAASWLRRQHQAGRSEEGRK
jgi:SAM-dependent methyltransferase